MQTHNVYACIIFEMPAWHGDEAAIADLPPPTSTSSGPEGVYKGSVITVHEATDDEEFVFAAVTYIVNDDTHVNVDRRETDAAPPWPGIVRDAHAHTDGIRWTPSLHACAASDGLSREKHRHH